MNEETVIDFFENAHDLLQIVALDGTLIYVNHSWSKLLGYSLSEIRGKSLYSFIYEEDRPFFLAYRDNVLAGSSDLRQITFRCVTKGGDIVFLEGAGSVRFKDNLPYYTRGIFRDITLKMQQAADLKKSEKNLQQLLLNAPDAVIVINADSLIGFWNPAAEKLFGWISAEVINRPLSDFIVPEQHRKAHREGMNRFLATGQSNILNKTIEITAINKQDEEFFISLTISATSFNGQPAFISFLRDIRQQKKIQEELEQHQFDLEASNNQLQQFAHVASHDMQEPIRKILVFGEMLEKEMAGRFTDSGKIYFDKILVSASRLQKLVAGVLKFATTSNIEGSFHNNDLNHIVHNIENDLEIPIHEKKASIEHDPLPKIHGIDFLLYQLMYNLINNSLKFSRDTVRPVIRISGREVPATALPGQFAAKYDRYVEIRVEDNGIGFKQEYASEIFKTFTRLNNRNKYEGTGLGLALCLNIMHRHQGYIMAESVPNEGASFIMFFPVHGLTGV